MFLLYFKNLLINNVDISAFYLTIVISLIQILSKNQALMDLSHFLYCFVYLILVVFFSNNKYLLGLNILMIFNIITLRSCYKGCILAENKKNKGIILDINKFLVDNLKFWDWEYIFILLFVVSIYRFLKVIF